MRRAAACFMIWLLVAAPALAITHLQANRIHLFNAGHCGKPTGPFWLTIGSGQPFPGFINVTPPAFDQIGALITGSQRSEPEGVLARQSPACGIIASFYKNGAPIGAWPVPENELPQLLAILNING